MTKPTPIINAAIEAVLIAVDHIETRIRNLTVARGIAIEVLRSVCPKEPSAEEIEARATRLAEIASEHDEKVAWTWQEYTEDALEDYRARPLWRELWEGDET
jgi:hypothetical protein